MKQQIKFVFFILTATVALASLLWADVKSGEALYAQQNPPGTIVDGERADGSSVNANNTRLNVRDRDRDTVTPLDQGNDKADVEMTAAIRKDILDQEGMSVDAQNVKVITQNGLVTLRGPVKSAQEKALIAEIALNRAGVQNVDDQLEVVRPS